jgi:hypothetical protein
MSDAETAEKVEQLCSAFWRLYGRINALENVCLQIIEDLAPTRTDPKAYLLQYVERLQERASIPIAEVKNAEHADTVLRLRDAALAEFLKDVLAHANLLKPTVQH